MGNYKVGYVYLYYIGYTSAWIRTQELQTEIQENYNFLLLLSTYLIKLQHYWLSNITDYVVSKCMMAPTHNQDCYCGPILILQN